MDNIDYEVVDLPLESVQSVDGTTIAYQRLGDGPAVVIVGGGLNEKAMHAELAAGLSSTFTVYNYDRRARGASGGDRLEPYDVRREVEDFDAVVRAAGQPCHVFANCTGGVLAIEAAVQGVQISKLAMYEPPFGVDMAPDWYIDELRSLLAEGRRTDAVALFLRWDALFTDEEVAFFRTHPIWPAFEAMAPSMIHDSLLGIAAHGIRVDQLAAVDVPSLVLHGNQSPADMIEGCRVVAEAMPRGRTAGMDSAGHLMDDVLGVELLTRFFLE